MEANHTPGPWSVVPYGDGESLAIHSDADRRVCFMATPGCRDAAERRRVWSEIKANARLIAAAPDMLDALADAASWLTGDMDIREADMLARVRAAIAKAMGEVA